MSQTCLNTVLYYGNFDFLLGTIANIALDQGRNSITLYSQEHLLADLQISVIASQLFTDTEQ